MRTYGILDVGLAALYAWLGFALVPGRSTAFNVALGAVVLLLAASGLSLMVQARWARRLGVVAASALLAFAAVVISGLTMSAAYVRGIYRAARPRCGEPGHLRGGAGLRAVRAGAALPVAVPPQEMKWLLAFAALQAALFAAVWGWARMPGGPPADGRAILAALRDGKPAPGTAR